LRKVEPEISVIVTFTGSLRGELIGELVQQNIGLVPEEGDITPTLSSQLHRSLNSDAGVERLKQKRVDLEIALDTEDDICTYQFQCEGQISEPAQVLQINTKEFKELVEESREVIAKPRWEHELRKIGHAVAGHLFLETPRAREFRDKFNQWLGVVGGMSNIRIRFVVKQDLHPIALEALIDEQAKEDEMKYWMLQSPIYRRLYRREAPPGLEPRALFQDDETRNGLINFLIIAADASGRCGELNESYTALSKLDDEVNNIEAQLIENKQTYHIGKIRVIRKSGLPDGVSFRQAVEETLTQEIWHVVHFAGHTDFKNGTGYVLLPGSGVSPVEAAQINVFAWWLARSNFVYLSSCQSAEQDFLFHLEEENVPAILGFRWKVEDDKARDFAECFYKYLFGGEEKTLEYAFLKARQQMYRCFSDNPIWAAPVLVIQVATEKVRSAA